MEGVEKRVKNKESQYMCKKEKGKDRDYREKTGRTGDNDK